MNARTLLVAAAVAAAAAPPAAAQTAPSGPVVVRNTSRISVELANLTYTDRRGVERAVPDATWSIPESANGALTVRGDKIVARKVRVELVTDAGRTVLTWTARGAGGDGVAACTLTADDLAEHRRLLGKPAPVVALKPPAGPTEEQLKRGVVKVLGAVASHLVAVEIERDPDPSLFQVLAARAARKARDEIVGSALEDLFPQLAAGESATVRQMVCLALDDRLTRANPTQLQAKESLLAGYGRPTRTSGRPPRWRTSWSRCRRPGGDAGRTAPGTPSGKKLRRLCRTARGPHIVRKRNRDNSPTNDLARDGRHRPTPPGCSLVAVDPIAGS